MYIRLERNSGDALTKQIYKGIKEAILTHTLHSGARLPSTRELAHEMKISRNVVIEAYEQLIAEGYLYSVEGSGTYVGEGLNFEPQQDQRPEVEVKEPSIPASKRDLLYPLEADTISFRPGVPDLKSVPIDKWGKVYRGVTQTVKPEQLDYQNPFGTYDLRFELTAYLRRMRGVQTIPENILITGGAAQAFTLLKCLTQEDDYVLIENPSSTGLQHTLTAKGLPFSPISLDEGGIKVSDLPGANEKPPKLIFTTPSHQFPAGMVLPIQRRLALIAYARARDVYLVEDDYDSEFRYAGSPIPSMQSLAPDRVIYVGTFSKTLSPAIRMGYMILPDGLLKVMGAEKYVADIHSPILEQLTMARFLSEGAYEKHIQKMKRIYAKRRQLLIDLLTETFGADLSISGINAGLHLIGFFKNLVFNQELMDAISAEKLDIWPLSNYYIKSAYTPDVLPGDIDRALIFGYGNTCEAEIRIGVERLAHVLDKGEKAQ